MPTSLLHRYERHHEPHQMAPQSGKPLQEVLESTHQVHVSISSVAEPELVEPKLFGDLEPGRKLTF